MPGEECLTLGVLIERCESGTPWQPWLWRPAGVVPGSPGNDEWRKLRDDGREAIFHAGHLPLRLHADEAASYLQNVLRPRPEVYVVLRRGEGADPERPVRPALLTAAPDEAAVYSEAEDGVHPVPMPPAVAAWVRRFAEAHHRPAPFVRRNRREREAREVKEAGPSRGGPARRRPAWNAPETS